MSSMLNLNSVARSVSRLARNISAYQRLFSYAASSDEFSFMGKDGSAKPRSTSSGFGAARGDTYGEYGDRGSRADMFGGRYDKEYLGANLRKIDWAEHKLEPFVKDFYRDRELPHIKNMSKDEVDAFREKTGMLVFGNNVPNPVKTFEETTIEPMYLQNLKNMKIGDPTPIQQQGIPMALSGRDIIGVSKTGSGKTLAYVLPGIVHINAQALLKPGEGPIVLVLAPTRELVMQIDGEINKFSRSSSYATIKHCAVFGGQKRERQLAQLRRQPEILVATPGRLIDFLETGDTNFRRCTYLVLDECDRMLDMGFQKDVEKIMSQIRPDRQTLLWSATWPEEIQDISNRFMMDPIRVQIGSVELVANEDISQNFKQLHPGDKLTEFVADCKEICERGRKCLAFANTKRECEKLIYALLKAGIPADCIHGDKSQMQRDDTMNKFRSGYTRVLVATDVVARGIDIRDIRVVVNYDLPTNIEDYVHRIGRTARAGDKGVSLSYVTEQDLKALGQEIHKLLTRSKQPVPDFINQSQALLAAYSPYRSRQQGRIFKQRAIAKEFGRTAQNLSFK